jgi:hypothetical protein
MRPQASKSAAKQKKAPPLGSALLSFNKTLTVIPSGARNLLFASSEKKQIPRENRPRNDRERRLLRHDDGERTVRRRVIRVARVSRLDVACASAAGAATTTAASGHHANQQRDDQ